MRPSFTRLRYGAALLALSILMLLVLEGDWVKYGGFGVGVAGAFVVLTAVGRPRSGETPPFLD